MGNTASFSNKNVNIKYEADPMVPVNILKLFKIGLPTCTYSPLQKKKAK